MTPLISVTMQPWNMALAVALAGELDLETVRRIEPALMDLAADGDRDLILDLGRLTFCDSSGAALFIRLHWRCAGVGTRLRLRRVPRLPARVLRTLGVDRVVPFSSP
ncbi:STAS domain-containing protein [Streptomyces sp. AM8-1-1]|uniref:STAS domain-containing protein n=1 Tax=Streptomyces sp. AM8-1-1 TaxID=3075825 RepID=UPI0028C4BE02|nr:STAS domain-containing protein [Streptomyces sp. AM8-1-1]WNO70282.1 STAS domain-containing protein [Streptomyces sp. AM8-1-1]